MIMIRRILRFTAVVATGASLSTGFVSANSASIDMTGPNSRNRVEFRNSDRRKVDNNNTIGLRNNNPQRAYSGDVKVKHNTTGGSANSGDATNDSLLRATLNLNNSSASSAALSGGNGGSNSGTIDTTGPSSHNTILFNDSSRVRVTNNNNIQIENNNDQEAVSGDAKVKGNTTAGDATSGNASNVSTTEVNLNITN